MQGPLGKDQKVPDLYLNMYCMYYTYNTLSVVHAMKVKAEIRERIINAANALVTEGISNPTNEQVREKLGGGSLSHISPAMREWRESQRTDTTSAIEMPIELKKIVDSTMSQVWASANKLAQAAFQAYRDEAESNTQEATRERDEALAEIQRLEAQIALLETGLSQKEKELKTATSELERERLAHLKVSAENTVLTDKAKDNGKSISELKAEISDARRDNKDLQAQLIAIVQRTNGN